jgi:hypothetical protein
MRVLISLLTFVLGACGSDDSCPSSAPSIGASCSASAPVCTYDVDGNDRECYCAGGTWACSTCGDTQSCEPGAVCAFADWERDCDCTCAEDGTWRCTPYYSNYGCPFGGTP